MMSLTSWLAIRISIAALLVSVLTVTPAAAVTPTVVWSQPDPGLQSQVGAVAWSPSSNGLVADGTGARWVRIRDGGTGSLLRSILQPRHTDGVVTLLFSRDGRYLAVANASDGLSRPVYDAQTATLLGRITATVQANGVVRYAADPQLDSSGAGNLANWRLSELPVFVSTGSGYQRVTTRLALSPNGSLQTGLSKGTLTVKRASDGATLATRQGTSSAFSPDSKLLALWDSQNHRAAVLRTSDWIVSRTLDWPDAETSGISLGFTAAGDRLIGSGYLAFVGADGTWQQMGVIRSWTVSTGASKTYDRQTGIAVTSGIAFSPAGTRMLYGTYEGVTTAAAYP
jgi:WD40 repeat protein